MSKLHSLRTKLLLSFLLCALIPLFLCSVLLVQITESRLNHHNEAEIHQQMLHLDHSVESLDQGLQEAAEQLSQNRNIMKILNGHHVDSTVINSQLFLETEAIRAHATLALYNSRGAKLYSTANSQLPDQLPLNWGILRSADDAPGKSVYSPATDSENLYLQGAVCLQKPNGKPLGYLVLSMDETDFFRLFEGKYSAQTELLIVSKFWHPVYASNPDLMQSAAPALRMHMLANTTPEQEDYSYEVSQNEATGLYLILRQPLAFNKDTTHMMYIISLSCSLFCIILAVAIYLPTSKQFTKPIEHLQTAFGQLEQDDFGVQLPTTRKDEMGQLARDFNLTVKALKENREERIRNQQELNDAQIRLLQTQLNPHFLCNTLDTMKWISKIHKVPEVAEMSANLADILRYCITSEEFVPLYREMEFLDRYVQIQKIRMGDKFDFQVDMPDSLACCIVPKMILQPLVENAIIHGLSDLDDSWIQLRVRTVDDLLKITVTDNGCGIPDELAGKPYVRPANSEGKHLGLYNVDTILSKHYGPGCGLMLNKGENGVGTCVTATLPAKWEEP